MAGVLRAALLTAAAAMAGFRPAVAAKVEHVHVSVVRDEIPSITEGAWRNHVQLVWDDERRALKRQQYRVWDPLAKQRLDLFWISKDRKRIDKQTISGNGILLWYAPGSARYDAANIVASYNGNFRDGMAEGKGEFSHVSGYGYRGNWHRGLMSGQGKLQFAQGDEYTGSFENGAPEGSGVYVDRTGRAYEGGFMAGKRHGSGRVISAVGDINDARWVAGAEVEGSRHAVKESAAVQVATEDATQTLRIGIAVDRRPVPSLDYGRALIYASESSPERLRIFPDDERLLDMWTGSGDINLTADELSDSSLRATFLGRNFVPAPVLFDLENIGQSAVDVIAGFIEIERSSPELTPAIQMHGAGTSECGPGSDLGLTFQNFGWADAEAGQLALSFVTENGKPIGNRQSYDLDTIGDAYVDMTEALKQAGVDLERLSSEPVQCDPGADCLAQARASGVFGSLTEGVRLSGGDFRLGTSGTLSYGWRDAVGTRHERRSNFNADLRVASLQFAECGEGGDSADQASDAFLLDTTSPAHRIDFQLKDHIPAGVTARWRLKLDSDRSSTQRFRIGLKIADGREVVSRPVELLYFKSRAIQPN